MEHRNREPPYSLSMTLGAGATPQLAADVYLQLAEHFVRKGYGTADRITLQVRVDATKILSNRYETVFHVSGTVGTRRLEKRFVQVLRRTPLPGTRLDRLFTITPARDPDSDEKMETCRRECVTELCLAIDLLLLEADPARGENDVAVWWNWLGLVRWAVSLGVALPVVAYGLWFKNPKTPVAVMLFMGLIMALSLFGIVHVLRMAFMPARFLRNDPRGQHALRRSGVGNIWGMRLTALFAALVFGSIAGFLGFMFYSETK